MNRELTANYAIRARQFSDAVARLGQHRHIGPGFLGLLQQVMTLQALCLEAGSELQSYVEEVTRTQQHSAALEQQSAKTKSKVRQAPSNRLM
jgi:hypothetical protein